MGVSKGYEEKIPNRIINVFHIEDGQKGLDRLIEYSDYIALSVPELRILKKKEYLYTLGVTLRIRNQRWIFIYRFHRKN